MHVTNTFTTNDKSARLIRQAELHRKCILLLKAKATKP